MAGDTGECEMAAPAPSMKIIWAEGADLDFARRLCRHIEERYVLRPVRYRPPVRLWVEDISDSGVLAGLTDLGWDKLDLEVFKLGRVGFRGFIGTWARWDYGRGRVKISSSCRTRGLPAIGR